MLTARLNCTCLAVMAVMPMLVPDYHRGEITGKLYISGSFTKFIEQARMDWIPLELSSVENLAASMDIASGVLIPSSAEPYDSAEQMAWYRQQTAAVLANAERINQSRFFPVIAVGLGAQLLLSALSNNTLLPVRVSSAGLPLAPTWRDLDGSTFAATFPQLNLITATSFPFATRFAFSLEEIDRNAWYATTVRTLAETRLNDRNATVVLAAFEARAWPYFGFLAELHRVQFFRDETQDAPKDVNSEDAAFALALGLLRLARRGECGVTYEEMIRRQSAWRWDALSGFAGVFEDFYHA